MDLLGHVDRDDVEDAGSDEDDDVEGDVPSTMGVPSRPTRTRSRHVVDHVDLLRLEQLNRLIDCDLAHRVEMWTLLKKYCPSLITARPEDVRSSLPIWTLDAGHESCGDDEAFISSTLWNHQVRELGTRGHRDPVSASAPGRRVVSHTLSGGPSLGKVPKAGTHAGVVWASSSTAFTPGHWWSRSSRWRYRWLPLIISGVILSLSIEGFARLSRR